MDGKTDDGTMMQQQAGLPEQKVAEKKIDLLQILLDALREKKDEKKNKLVETMA